MLLREVVHVRVVDGLHDGGVVDQVGDSLGVRHQTHVPVQFKNLANFLVRACANVQLTRLKLSGDASPCHPRTRR